MALKPKMKESNQSDRFVPRKGPKQQRSRITVDSIKQATLELVEKNGFSSLTTADIAGRAGVSIGTFYDYFPNREAVLMSLFEGASSQLVEDMRNTMASILDSPSESAVSIAIKKLLALHEKYKLILIDLVTEMPGLKLKHHPMSFDSLGRGSIYIFLEHRGKRMTAEELECRVFFVQHVMNGSIREYLSSHTNKISRKKFIENLTVLMVPYIKEITSPRRLTTNAR